MDDLIARLEAAPEGSRELDQDIFFAVHDQDREAYRAVGPPGVLPYTTSLDAALTLVPEGCQWGLEVWGENGGNAAWVMPPHGHPSRYAATPALAICIAALKAGGE